MSSFILRRTLSSNGECNVWEVVALNRSSIVVKSPETVSLSLHSVSGDANYLDRFSSLLQPCVVVGVRWWFLVWESCCPLAGPLQLIKRAERFVSAFGECWGNLCE